MAFCRNCGAEMSDEQLYCLNCGAPMQVEPTPPAAPEKQKLNVGSLVFSIINLVCCCQIMGIISLVMTIMAQNETEEGSKKKLKIALILNIIGVVVGGIITIVYFILALSMGLAEAGLL